MFIKKRRKWESHREKEAQGGVNLGNQQEPINTGENMLTFNTLLVLYLDPFGFGVTHIQFEACTVETLTVHAHTQTQLHIDIHTYIYCTSPPTTTQLYPKVHTEFMVLPARAERAQLPLIQGLHGQIVVSLKFPPHTPKLESAYRVKNMFFFSGKLCFFSSGKILYFPAKSWKNEQNPNAGRTDGLDGDTWVKIGCDESLAQRWTNPLKSVPCWLSFKK